MSDPYAENNEQNGAPAGVTGALPQTPWTSGICGCCDDCGGMCSMIFCRWCNFGYMGDRLEKLHTDPMSIAQDPATHVPQINYLCCGLALLGDFLSSSVGSIVVGILLRMKIREQYNIEGGVCGDVLCGFFCAPLSWCQIYREMGHRGTWPGATCCAIPGYAVKLPQVQTMGVPPEQAPVSTV